MFICPVRVTYNNVSISLCSRTKKAFKLPSRATFAISKFPYLFRIAQFTRKFQFLSQICQMMTSTISGIHVTRRLIWLELTHSTIFLSSNRLWHGSLMVIKWDVNPILCGSLLMFWFFSKIGRMVICPVRVTYNHVSIFLCSRTKKEFKLPSRAIFAISKFPYLLRIAQLTQKFQFLS